MYVVCGSQSCSSCYNVCSARPSLHVHHWEEVLKKQWGELSGRQLVASANLLTEFMELSDFTN